MKSGTFIKITLGLLLVLLIAFASLTFIVDPLLQYHKPWFGLIPSINDERYQNPGIAKICDFDTVIMGNSLSQNIRGSWVDKAFGGTTVKLTMVGAYWSDYAVILDILVAREKQPDIIIWNMPITLSPLDEYRLPLPLYLYDSVLINDVQYLLNKDIFRNFTYTTLAQNKNNNVPNYDEAFVWDKWYPVGKAVALEKFGERRPISTSKTPPNQYHKITTEYLERMRPYLQSMPDTQFYIWIPPYSMLYWDSEVRTGTAEALLGQQAFALEGLLKFDNVSLFMFTDQSWQEKIADLDNYKDSTHFGTDISRSILDSIINGRDQVTSSNLKEKMEEFSNFILQFDYDSLFE